MPSATPRPGGSPFTASDSTESGKAILKKIGLPGGFQYSPPKVFVEFLAWLGELEDPAARAALSQ
jgi:hypothetical protein